MDQEQGRRGGSAAVHLEEQALGLRPASGQLLRQLFHGSGDEHRAERDVYACLGMDPLDHFDGFQGMATDVEEVLPHTDRTPVQ